MGKQLGLDSLNDHDIDDILVFGKEGKGHDQSCIGQQHV